MKSIRRYALLLATLGWFVGPVMANDFGTAMQAYEQQDYRQAYSLFSKLAAAGDHDAQYMLGRHYETGNGVLQDFVDAHKWYNLAAAGGHRHASGARDTLAARMTSNQIAEAQQRARQWQPSTAAPDLSPSPPSTPAQPSQREIVTGVQRELNRLGYDAGPVDGLMGQRTRNAISDFQADAGLSVDGQASFALLARLEGTSRPPATPPTPPVERPERWRTLFRDDFSDPERSRRDWTVVSGEFNIGGGALRSVVEPQRGVRIPDSDRPEDIGIAILETIIGQATGQRPSEARSDPAEIYLAEDFGERFRIELELLSRQPFGELSIGPYRGSRRDQGYRLRYTPDGDTTLALLRITGDGERVMARSSRRINLEDGRRHLLTWARHRNGDMEIALNEQPLFSAEDTDEGRFRGVNLINRSGDFSLYRLQIDTAR